MDSRVPFRSVPEGRPELGITRNVAVESPKRQNYADLQYVYNNPENLVIFLFPASSSSLHVQARNADVSPSCTAPIYQDIL